MDGLGAKEEAETTRMAAKKDELEEMRNQELAQLFKAFQDKFEKLRSEQKALEEKLQLEMNLFKGELFKYGMGLYYLQFYLQANVNAWLGTDLLLPFVGAFLADSFVGHYLTIVISSIIYILDNLSWSLGFGIPCISMILSLLLFLLGIPTYRYKITKRDFERCGNLCNFEDIEGAKATLRLIPIWITSLVFAIVIAQCQGKTMDREIFSSGFEVPAASLQSFIPIYDRVFVPIARTFTKEPAGIAMLQRIGTGILLSAVCMLVAALIETRRLEIAEKNGLVDQPNAIIPMSMWWLVPQYVLLGAADVFTRVGLQEFFYDQISSELKSVGLALYLSVFGVGNFLSSFLVSMVEKATAGAWLPDNLNQGHLNYFYCLLVGVNLVGIYGGILIFFYILRL